MQVASNLNSGTHLLQGTYGQTISSNQLQTNPANSIQFNGLSEIRQEQVINSNKLSQNEIGFQSNIPEISNKGQFLQSNHLQSYQINNGQSSQAKQLSPSSRLQNSNLQQSKLLFSSNQKQEKSDRSNILFSNNNFELNDNWTQNDYLQQFEKQLEIINENNEYLRQLNAKRLIIPEIRFIIKDIHQKQEDIISKSTTQSTSLYINIIKPQVLEMMEQQEKLQESLKLLDQQQVIPKNYYIQQLDVQRVSGIQNFQQLLQQLDNDFKHQTNKLSQIIMQLKQQEKQQLYDNQNNESLQQELVATYSEIEEFLKNKMTQTLTQLNFLQEREVFHLKNEINIKLQQQDMRGISFFIEKFLFIQNQIDQFFMIKQELKQFQQKLISLKNNYSDFFEFHKQITQFYFDYNKYFTQIKTLQFMKNEYILQKYQQKIKEKCLNIGTKLYRESKQLYFNGLKIISFNLEEKVDYLKTLNLQQSTEHLQQYSQYLNKQYVNKGVQIPLQEAKNFKNSLYQAEEEYFKLVNIRKQLNDLENQEFINYKTYVSQILKPQFNFEMNIYLDDYLQLINFQYADAIVLGTVKDLIQFQFPYFDWQENIQDEFQRINLIETRLKDIQDFLQEYSSQYSKETKFMKQVLGWQIELEKCLAIIQQYLNIKQALWEHKINVQEWPIVNFNTILQFSPYCEKIIIQANSRLNAISQLNRINILQNIRIIFKTYNSSSKQDIQKICEYFNEEDFSPIISQQMNIIYEFLFVCYQIFEKNIDEVFCSTNTYAEIQEQLGKQNKFLELKRIFDDDIMNVELRFKIYEIIEPFIHEKLNQQFEQLFTLKLQQSQDGNSNYDPFKLQFRTDLLFPINRIDIQENEYCKQNSHLINKIIDQPELRKLFELFKDLLIQITHILNQDTQFIDLSINQTCILDIINNFISQNTLQNEIANITLLQNFHKQLQQWPNQKQLNNLCIQLGIVFPELYQQYLSACRMRILRLVEGITIEINSLDQQIIESILFNVDDQECSLNQISSSYIYRDTQSIILKKQQMKIKVSQNQSNAIIRINEKTVLLSQQIQL